MYPTTPFKDIVAAISKSSKGRRCHLKLDGQSVAVRAVKGFVLLGLHMALLIAAGEKLSGNACAEDEDLEEGSQLDLHWDD